MCFNYFFLIQADLDCQKRQSLGFNFNSEIMDIKQL